MIPEDPREAFLISGRPESAPGVARCVPRNGSARPGETGGQNGCPGVPEGAQRGSQLTNKSHARAKKWRTCRPIVGGHVKGLRRQCRMMIFRGEHTPGSFQKLPY